MTSPSRRPLPTPPSATGASPQGHHLVPVSADMHFSQYQQPYPQLGSSPSTPRLNVSDEPPTTILPGGTLLHQGFYDLLAMIPTPSPSRLLWGAGWNQQPLVAGPRYEDQSPQIKAGMSIPTPQISAPAASKKGRRISKDMVSKPTGFVCVYCCQCGRALSVHSLTLFPVTLFMPRMQIKLKLF